jgi:hypothetical protein
LLAAKASSTLHLAEAVSDMSVSASILYSGGARIIDGRIEHMPAATEEELPIFLPRFYPVPLEYCYNYSNPF